jgi:hypothetical protein
VRIVQHPDGRIEIDLGTSAAADLSELPTKVIKAVAPLQYTLALAYPAGSLDKGVARDGFRDFAGAEAVRDAAWDYLEKCRDVGVLHADGTSGAGRVVESFLWPDGAPDWQAGDQLIKSGDWLIGTVWGDRTWAEIEAERLRGVSPQGSARRRRPTAEAKAAAAARSAG